MLPKVNSRLYKRIFNLSYNFFYFLKPSQLWIIILALINKTPILKLIQIPSIFILFSSILFDSESINTKIDSKSLIAKLDENKLTDSENNWENFFWFLIVLALIKRVINNLFKILWIPFKIALIYYILKYFGFDFSSLFNLLNNLSLGVIDWFYLKIIDFFNLIFNNKNDKIP